MSLILTGNFISLKPNYLANSLLDFVILAGLRSAGIKYLTIFHLKLSLSSMFLLLINPSLGWSDSLGNFMELLPAQGLFFEILIVRSMTE